MNKTIRLRLQTFIGIVKTVIQLTVALLAMYPTAATAARLAGPIPQNTPFSYLHVRVDFRQDWKSTLVVVNVGAGRATIQLSAYDVDGRLVQLTPGGRALMPGERRTYSEESGDWPKGTFSLKVESDNPLISFLQSEKEGSGLEVVLPADEPATTLTFPLLIKPKESWAEISIVNAGFLIADLQIIALDRDGRTLSEKYLGTLSPMASLTLQTSSLFHATITDSTAVFEVVSNQPLTGVHLFSSDNQSDIAALSALLSAGQELFIPVFTEGGGVPLWTHVGLFNPRDGPVNIAVEAFDANKQSLGRLPEITSLSAHASYSFQTSNIGGTIPAETALIKITAEQPVNGYEAIGIRNGTGVTATFGIPIEDQTTAGIEIIGSNDGGMLAAYPLVRLANGGAESVSGMTSIQEGFWKRVSDAAHDIERRDGTDGKLAERTAGVAAVTYSAPNLGYSAYNSGPFANLIGQCTWYVYARIQETGLITSSALQSATNRNGGSGIFLGNASTWIKDAQSAGFQIGSQPRVGAIAVWPTVANGLGHVAFVEDISSGTVVTQSNNTPVVGNTIVVNFDTRLRSSPGTGSPIIAVLSKLTIMTVIGGPKSVGGYQWFQLQGNGLSGWSAWLNRNGSAAKANSLDWNFTRIQLRPGSVWITSSTPTFIYLTAAADTTPPATPSNLAATAASSSQINLSWTGSTDSGGSGLAGYKIERCTGSGCTSFAQIATTTSTSYSNTGLTAGTTYSYRVRAYDNAGNNSGYSNTASATTSVAADTTPPTTPSGLSASAASSSQINLGWTGSTDSGGSGLAGYKIERCTGGGCTSFAPLTTTTSTSYSDTGLSASTSYSYRVRAYDNAGNNSGYSNTASATTSASSVLPDLVVSSLGNPPSSVTQGGSIALSATVINQGTGSAGAYRLGFYFSTDSTITTGDILFATCDMSALTAGQSQSCSGSVTVPSIAPGTYYLGACADDLGGVSESSETNNCRASTTTVQVTGSAPGSFTLFSPTSNCPGKVPAIHLDWSDSTGVSHYDLYRNNLSYANTATDSFFHNTASVTFGTTYSYFVRAVGSTGLSTDSNSVSIRATCSVTVGGTGGIGLKLRTCASTNDAICPKITTLPDGTVMTIIGGPVQADGFTWYNVTGTPGTGWSVGDWLSPNP